MIFQLTNKVKKETGLKLSLAEVMKGMTLRGLATAMQRHLETGDSQGTTPADAPAENVNESLDVDKFAEGDDPRDLLTNFHHLSDEQKQRLLAKMTAE